MRWLVNIACVAVWTLSFFIDVSVLGFSTCSPAQCRLLYAFAHISVLHLTFNLLSYNVFCNVLNKLQVSHYQLIAFVCAVCATFGSECTTSTIGLSGVVFAMLGITTYYVQSQQFLFALACVFASNIITGIFGNSNSLLHVLAFFYGLTFTIILNNLSLLWQKNSTSSLLNNNLSNN